MNVEGKHIKRTTRNVEGKHIKRRTTRNVKGNPMKRRTTRNVGAKPSMRRRTTRNSSITKYKYDTIPIKARANLLYSTCTQIMTSDSDMFCVMALFCFVSESPIGLYLLIRMVDAYSHRHHGIVYNRWHICSWV